jgi:hypothetical protein
VAEGTRLSVHFCGADAVCGEKNRLCHRAFGVIIRLFWTPPQKTQTQTHPYVTMLSTFKTKLPTKLVEK